MGYFRYTIIYYFLGKTQRDTEENLGFDMDLKWNQALIKNEWKKIYFNAEKNALKENGPVHSCLYIVYTVYRASCWTGLAAYNRSFFLLQDAVEKIGETNSVAELQ